jgi:hypothetical protein
LTCPTRTGGRADSDSDADADSDFDFDFDSDSDLPARYPDGFRGFPGRCTPPLRRSLVAVFALS